VIYFIKCSRSPCGRRLRDLSSEKKTQAEAFAYIKLQKESLNLVVRVRPKTPFNDGLRN
jgi:hypothetical protein